jgi:hypothetical protein
MFALPSIAQICWLNWDWRKENTQAIFDKRCGYPQFLRLKVNN